MNESDHRPVYPELTPWDLEPHYCRHTSAMTTEGLDSKHDIAKQLAWRDQLLEKAVNLLCNAAPVTWAHAPETQPGLDAAHAWEHRVGEFLESLGQPFKVTK